MNKPVQHIAEETFETVDDLCSKIHSATKGWDTRWYRGVKNPGYLLSPKLLRDQAVARREAYIATEFRRRAHSKLRGVSSQFDWLCAMQHYGLPTRLLDWTESLAVALYFSIRPLGNEVPIPTIWVLDPHALYQNIFKTPQSLIPTAEFPSVRANADISFGDLDDEMIKHRTRAPLPVAPNFIFDRLSTQNSAFTLHGTSPAPLEEYAATSPNPFLRKFVASKTNIAKIYGTLDLVIPSDDSMFPDIEGIKNLIV